MTIEQIFHEAQKRGLRLESRGDKLAVIPANRLKSDFAVTLQKHKRDLLAFLEAAPWLHVAKQIVLGEFDSAIDPTVNNLITDLKTINHPACRLAVERLQGMQSRQ